MKNHVKNGTKYLLSLSLVAFVSACGIEGNTGTNSVEDGSSELVSARVIDDVNASTVLAYIKGGIDANATNAFEYKAVKITYNTVGENNESIVASGLLVIPTPTPQYVAYRTEMGEQPFSISMICNNHGTRFLNSDAPTNVEVKDGVPNYSQALLMTGYAGFASIFPDYIGFGASKGVIHPYIMKKSSARASLDMVKASMKYMEKNGVVLNHQLYISGYSEGGYNAMAFAQSVENGNLSNVNLMGVAPMAGPYNIEDLANIDLIANKKMAYPAFLADLAYSYAHYYDDVNLSDIVVPSLQKFQLAFDGSHDTVPIHIILGLGKVEANATVSDYGFYTHTTDELFQSDFITEYQATPNAKSGVRAYFRDNSLDNYNWTSPVKMNFIQCLDDDIIPFSESNNTYNKFKTDDANAILTGIPTIMLKQQKDATHPFVHVNCIPEAYGVAVKWFSAIRNGDI